MRQRAALFGTFAAAGICLLAPGLPALAHGGHEHGAHEEHGAGDEIYGRPGKAQDVRRTITLIATEMRYSESELTFVAGETIKFVLTNKGRQDHELMIADAHEQIEHRMMMLSMEGRIITTKAM